MIIVPSLAMSHLVAIAEQEIARLRAIHEAVGDDWPDEFDPNDIDLFMMARDDLRPAPAEDIEALAGIHTINRMSKPLRFLLGALHEYVDTGRVSLTVKEHAALKWVYDHYTLDGVEPFPGLPTLGSK